MSTVLTRIQISAKKAHLANSDRTVYCGRHRTDIETLVGPPVRPLRRYICVRCWDRYWGTPTKQRYVNRG